MLVSGKMLKYPVKKVSILNAGTEYPTIEKTSP